MAGQCERLGCEGTLGIKVSDKNETPLLREGGEPGQGKSACCAFCGASAKWDGKRFGHRGGRRSVTESQSAAAASSANLLELQNGPAFKPTGSSSTTLYTPAGADKLATVNVCECASKSCLLARKVGGKVFKEVKPLQTTGL